MNPHAHTNPLIHETSPYLQQHAYNPVEWYPWGEAALTRAREQDKPILLSVGYSACHWCHVMAHESFEDAATAKVMNGLFVNIKVDREERPDLDKIYQLAHAAISRRNGGWPLTMFLTPGDLIPFFGGTYFPNQARHGLPAFKDLLVNLAAYYREHPEEVRKQSDALMEFFTSIEHQNGTGPSALEDSVLGQGRAELAASFEPQHGGFGRAPKFPHPTNIDRALRHWAASCLAGEPDQEMLRTAEFSLEKMALGGVYDQLGGGFCRYSVDDYWMIPHFEKMLYDNGPLLALYSEAWCATGKKLFKQVAQETGTWVQREMQSSEGGFYSTLDADSEGAEGKFYVWSQEEIKADLNDEQYAALAEVYGLNRPPNFEGHWHLHTFVGREDAARRLGKSREEIDQLIDSARGRLFDLREPRVRPGRDEKVLTAWNGLMIKGMASAGRRLGREDFIESAERALHFVRKVLWKEGRLLATYKDGKAHLMAYLDDYAFMIDGILELLQARWRGEDLTFACELAEVVLKHFSDEQGGGFYFTADDHEALLYRPKPLADEATPSGNGVVAYSLNRLGHLLGETRYLEAAESSVKGAMNSIRQAAIPHATLLNTLEELLSPPHIVILRGGQEAIQSWQHLSAQDYAPRRFTLAIGEGVADLPEAVAARKPQGGCVAYVCQGMTCSAPIVAEEDYKRTLAATAARTAKS